MKRTKLLAAVVLLVIVTAVSVVFAGCNKSSDQNTAQNPNGNFGGGNFDPAARQQSIKEALSKLVTAGTISQSQADAISKAMTAGFGGSNNGGRSAGSMPSGSFSSGSLPSMSGSRPNRGNFASGSMPQGRGQGANLLSSLVQAGTITQAQADAVMQAINGNTQTSQ